MDPIWGQFEGGKRNWASVTREEGRREGSEKGRLSMSPPDTKVCLEVGVQISQRMCKMEQGLFVSVPKCCSQEMGGFPVHNEQ